ncbi:unnamed protein product [Rotaria socialis]|nr:unnamed protein product [Rotaria socialis]
MDPWRQRPLQRRVIDKDDTGLARCNRFCFPDKPATKALGNSGIWMSPFVEKWIEKNPNYKYKEDQILDQIAAGLEHEGCEVGEFVQAKMVGKLIRNRKGQARDQIIEYCVRLYTKESWIYPLINKVLREEDLSKVDTLGAFCCYIRSYLYERQKKSRGEVIVYRGINLEPKDIELYKKSVGEVKSWLSFASTSRNPEVAKSFLANVPEGKVPTFFIIRFESEFSQYFPGRDISDVSRYPTEAEVLLHPGADFRIKKVEENVGPSKWTIIHLALM